MSRLMVDLVVLAVVLFGQGVMAEVPQMINYQGVLTDSGGQGLNGAHYMTFTIYDAPAPPEVALWQESQTIEVSDGLFHVLLGSVTPLTDIVFDDTARYLGIRIGTSPTEPEISPRTRLVSSPYAFRVHTLDGASGGDIYGDVNLHSWLTVGDFDGDDGWFRVTDGEQITISLDGNDGSGGGIATLLNGGGVATFTADADEYGSGYSAVAMYDGENPRIYMRSREYYGYLGAVIELYSKFNVNTLKLRGGTEGSLINMYDTSGIETIRLEADYNGFGDGRIITDVLRIDGGGDLSEQFDVATGEGGGEIAAGMVVCIDTDCSGKLVISRKAYDNTVAGIISGAGGLNPGVVMGQTGTAATGAYPVALSGRVYCWADASKASILPGDPLTTSDIPGHAMKAVDYDRSRGAVIGKAMTSLEHGRGLVLVLVQPQ